jgi:hypothetical protein
MNPNNLLISGVYYILVALLSLFSIFGAYILIRYGKTTPLAITVAIVYGFLFLKILIETHQTLSLLLS